MGWIFFLNLELAIVGHVKKGSAPQRNEIAKMKMSGVNQSGIRTEKWTCFLPVMQSRVRLIRRFGIIIFKLNIARDSTSWINLQDS